MDLFKRAAELWTRLWTFIEGEAVVAREVMTDTEAKYLPNLEAFAAKMVATLKVQGIETLEDGLKVIADAFLKKEDVSDLIRDLVSEVLEHVREDVEADRRREGGREERHPHRHRPCDRWPSDADRRQRAGLTWAGCFG